MLEGTYQHSAEDHASGSALLLLHSPQYPYSFFFLDPCSLFLLFSSGACSQLIPTSLLFTRLLAAYPARHPVKGLAIQVGFDELLLAQRPAHAGAPLVCTLKRGPSGALERIALVHREAGLPGLPNSPIKPSELGRCSQSTAQRNPGRPDEKESLKQAHRPH